MGSYSGARQDVSNAGFQSAILTCQVRLLNEGESTSAAHSVAWIGVNNADQDDPKWAQMGYVRHWEEGEEDVYFQVYVEVQPGPNDETDYHRRYFDAPPNGFNVYKGVLGKATGTWTFYLNDGEIDSWTHNGWQDLCAVRLECQGEISDNVDDGPPFNQMVGTVENPCNFENCAYFDDDGAFQNADFEEASSTDTEYWDNEFIEDPVLGQNDGVSVWRVTD